MQYYQITKRTNKKAGFGLPDFFSILVFFLIIIIFYLVIKITIGSATFQVSEQSSNVADTISLINILRTPVVVGDITMNIGDLITLSKLDKTKKPILEQNLKQIIDHYFSASKCAIICIDNEKLKGSGCSSLAYFGCNENIVTIPSYDFNLIKVAFRSESIEPQIPSKPLK